MNKKIVFLVTLFILIGSLINPVSGDENTLVAAKFDTDTIDLNDGAISSGWDNVQYFQTIKEFGDNGFVKFANNDTHIFSLWKFDTSIQWVASEMEASDDCMVQLNDGWEIKIDEDSGELVTLDLLYRGAKAPLEDTNNDIVSEVMEKDGYYLVEMTRLLDTSDDQDLKLADGSVINMKFASSTHHYTSSIYKNPTDFGPSDIYALSVQLGGGEIIVPEAPKTIDYEFWKFTILISIFAMAAGFITLHFLVRQVFRPVSHPSRIVDKEFKRPTIEDRIILLKDDTPTESGEEK